MKENQQKLIESDYLELESDTPVRAEEKSLILLEPKTKKDVDQTISTPERYVSRYQYNAKSIDKYLQLCPHCKKPTLSAFDRSVVDSAIDYLNGKRIFHHYPKNEGKFFPGILFMLALCTLFYFLFNYI